LGLGSVKKAAKIAERLEARACPDGDSESFCEGCIAYVRGVADQADNGIGVATLINPDADDDDDDK
jgi:hypothetical protein